MPLAYSSRAQIPSSFSLSLVLDEASGGIPNGRDVGTSRTTFAHSRIWCGTFCRTCQVSRCTGRHPRRHIHPLLSLPGGWGGVGVGLGLSLSFEVWGVRGDPQQFCCISYFQDNFLPFLLRPKYESFGIRREL